jgi:hypothetical protein
MSLANKNHTFHPESKRTSISQDARNFLEHAFQVQQFPNRKDIEILAKKSKLKDSQVRTWVRISEQILSNFKLTYSSTINE